MVDESVSELLAALSRLLPVRNMLTIEHFGDEIHFTQRYLLVTFKHLAVFLSGFGR
jgi:hypothetical protein